MKKVLNSIWFWFLSIVIALAILYIPKLTGYQLSGDDLYLIDGAPRTIVDVGQRLIDFSGQYRPLTHSLFYFYRLLIPNTTLILGVNFLLMAGVACLFFVNLKRLTAPWWSAVLTVAVMMSPIFYYHFFAIAALNNALVILSALALCLLIDFKKSDNASKLKSKTKIILGSILLLLAMLSKESFLVNALLLFVILWQNLPGKKFWSGFATTISVLIIYFALHFYFYATPTGGDYALGTSIHSMINMALDMGFWLMGYPRGWQYGAADPKTWLTYLATLISAISLILIFVPWKHLLQTWKVQLLFLVSLGLSIAPFFIIDKSLVFYLDISILILVFWLVYNHQKLPKYNWVYAVMAASFVLQFALYYPQWHKYSFVANANEVAHNFESALIENDYQSYPTLCVVNHLRGRWGVKDGEAAKLLYGYSGHIISNIEDVVPAGCGENALILRNDGWNYKKL